MVSPFRLDHAHAKHTPIHTQGERERDGARENEGQRGTRLRARERRDGER